MVHKKNILVFNSSSQKLSGLTLVEVLVAVIVGSFMMAAIYYAYSVFSGSYVSIVEKVSVNKALRASMTDIIKDVRMAGYVDENSNIPNKTNFEAIRFDNNMVGSGGSDQISVIFDRPVDVSTGTYISNRIQSRYFLSPMDGPPGTGFSLFNSLTTCSDAACNNNSVVTPNRKISDFVESLQFRFYGDQGQNLTTFSSSQVKYVEISILIRSTNEIYPAAISKNFLVGEIQIPKNDRYYRDSLTVTVFPRNIIK